MMNMIPFDLAIIYHNDPSSKKKKKNDIVKNEKEEDDKNNDEYCMCSMTELITHLYDLKHDYCPVCSKHQHPINAIYDVISHSRMVTKEHDDTGSGDTGSDEQQHLYSKYYDLVSFKFHKQSYHLAVLKQEELKQRANFENDNEYKTFLFRHVPWLHKFHQLLLPVCSIMKLQTKTQQQEPCHQNQIEHLAQERIGNVLGIDYMQNMKILHRGKVIYPSHNHTAKALKSIQKDVYTRSLGGENNTTKSTSLSYCTPEQQVSQHLINLSNDDLLQNKRYPSLTVMGTRQIDIIAVESKTLSSKYDKYSHFIKDSLHHVWKDLVNHGFDTGFTILIIIGGIFMLWKKVDVSKMIMLEPPRMEL